MKREISMEEISDGKLYSLNDMVKAGCDDCLGCFACCCGMGNSIVLDPLDVYRLTVELSTNVQGLLTKHLELNVVDGIILPNLKMDGSTERCSFLNGEGRCSIHSFRPGICRLFPLGRYYENQDFSYFLQTKECRKDHKTKVKIRKWIDTPDIKEYEAFIREWHYFLLDAGNTLRSLGVGEMQKKVNLYLLNQFFITPYKAESSFYPQFWERLAEARSQLELGGVIDA